MHYINETKIIIFCFIKLKNIRYNILNKYIYDNKNHIYILIIFLGGINTIN